jgi:hypothetical protein
VSPEEPDVPEDPELANVNPDDPDVPDDPELA